MSDAAAEGVYLSPGHVYALSLVLRRPIVVYEHPGPIPGTGTRTRVSTCPCPGSPTGYCCRTRLRPLHGPRGQGGHFTALVFEGEYGGEDDGDDDDDADDDAKAEPAAAEGKTGGAAGGGGGGGQRSSSGSSSSSSKKRRKKRPDRGRGPGAARRLSCRWVTTSTGRCCRCAS